MKYKIKKSPTDKCRLCNNEIETTEHLFLHCENIDARFRFNSINELKYALVNPLKKNMFEKRVNFLVNINTKIEIHSRNC